MAVAVKTLKEGSGEEDRVKFLQEVAIMGQFKHHNVVEVYGVVTIGEPVSQKSSHFLLGQNYSVAGGRFQDLSVCVCVGGGGGECCELAHAHHCQIIN